MIINDPELESVWLSAWAPFAGVSPRNVRYLAHYPHDRFKRSRLLNQVLEITSAIDDYREKDWKGNTVLQADTAERLSSQFIDCILALFLQISPLWVGVQIPLSRDCRDIMNLSIATTLILREGEFVPILSALNAMIIGLAQNFNSSEAIKNLQAIPLDVLKLELFNELKLLTLNHPYRSGVDRKRISDFLTLHAVPREGYPIASVVGMFKSLLNRIQLKEQKRDLITACSNILDKADVWQQTHHNFALEEQLKLFDESQSHETDQGKPSKSAQKKQRKKANRRRLIAEKEKSDSLRMFAASKIQRQIRLYLNTRENAALTLQQFTHIFLQRIQYQRENQAAKIISHFIRHVHDTRIRDRAALLINAFLAKAYYRQKKSLRQNQWWFSHLSESTQRVALAMRHCVQQTIQNPDLVLYGSRLLEGTLIGSYLIQSSSDLDLIMVIPPRIDIDSFVQNLPEVLARHEYAFQMSPLFQRIFFGLEKKSVHYYQYTSYAFKHLSIDLTLIQYEKNSLYAGIDTLRYLSKNILKSDQLGLPLSNLTFQKGEGISVLSQRRLVRSFFEPDFSQIRRCSRNEIRNTIKKLLRALCINLSIFGTIPCRITPVIFELTHLTSNRLSELKLILAGEIVSLFESKLELLTCLLNHRGLRLFYDLLPIICVPNVMSTRLFDPLLIYQDYTPYSQRNPYYVIFSLQHFLFQIYHMHPTNYPQSMRGSLVFLQLNVLHISTMGMPGLFADCVNLYQMMIQRSEFVSDYAQIRGQLFALDSVMRPCIPGDRSSNDLLTDEESSTFSRLS
ncbi:MAG: hypothetical protein CL816_03695 [Coxiellaceae bacterium]|nr:hypothetical protein [Coxiellaceae bacterium]|tara:strand:- start:9505 stop:11886 length:2382 start_codon:yes stop_codon:yes gene_type:complete